MVHRQQSSQPRRRRGRMAPCPAPVTWASRSARCPPARPTRCSTWPASGSATPPSTATSPTRRADAGVARTGVTVLVLAEDAYPRPVPAGGAVLNGAGECTGFLTAAEWGAARDAGLPDLDDAARPGLRRGLRDRARAAPRGRRRRRHPGGRASATTPSSTTAGGCRSTARRRARRAWRAALASRGLGDAARRGGGRVRDRDVVPGLQGRHRHGVAGHSGRPHRRGAADDELRDARAADRRRRAGRPAAARRPRDRTRRAGRLVHRRRRHRRAVDGAGCARLARRVGLGLARTGSVAHHGSGEIFLAAAPGSGSTATGGPDGTAPGGRPRARPAVRGGGRGGRGGGAQLDARRRRPTVGRDGNTSEGLDPELC